jgi:hypothetical protein
VELHWLFVVDPQKVVFEVDVKQRITINDQHLTVKLQEAK